MSEASENLKPGQVTSQRPETAPKVKKKYDFGGISNSYFIRLIMQLSKPLLTDINLQNWLINEYKLCPVDLAYVF